ncbi:hypothetical protein IU459_32665 [Nocardia amamiensis]|uniref:Uncharacterized protein n=1 Tax=Nocardia amamiensis TaxID=404578 RepID=A0ABS0D093_9NOCA|nr:hypothetical protein [Nocardia amamiensis]MBF6302258.1 hypothetical protein [Nocardia amamiensis]
MNRNDIRPAAVGIAAGAAAFAGLIAWVEIDPWNSMAERVARRRLSPAERAEIERIEAKRDEWNREYAAKSKQDRESQRLQVQDGFCPQLLKTPDSVTSPQELSTNDLVAEIEYAEKSRYQYPISGDGSWFQHCEALAQEFRERRNDWETRSKLPRVERLRLDIAAERVSAAQRGRS